MSFTCKEPKLRFPEFSGEWVEKKLGEMGEFRGGGTPSKNIDEYWCGSIPWISSSDIEEDNIHKVNISRFINEKAIKESATKIIPKDSILFVSRVGVGKLAINKSELCTSQDFTNFIPKNSNSYYLGYFFIAKKNILVGFNQGTSIKGFTKNDLETLKVLLPSKPEQEKIASFLTAVDAKIEQLTCKEKLLEKYKKSVMQKLFSQELRFTCNDGSEYPEWEEKKLGEICLSISSGKSKVEENGKYLVYGSTGAIGNTNHFTHEGSYILVARVGANAGLTNLVSGKFGVTDNTLIIDIKNETNELKFILSVLNKYNLNRLVFGSGQPLITGGELKSLHVKLPSLPEQTKIANFLSAIDEKLLHVKAQLSQTQQFKKALLQQMFV